MSCSGSEDAFVVLRLEVNKLNIGMAAAVVERPALWLCVDDDNGRFFAVVASNDEFGSCSNSVTSTELSQLRSVAPSEMISLFVVVATTSDVVLVAVVVDDDELDRAFHPQPLFFATGSAIVEAARAAVAATGSSTFLIAPLAALWLVASSQSSSSVLLFPTMSEGQFGSSLLFS